MRWLGGSCVGLLATLALLALLAGGCCTPAPAAIVPPAPHLPAGRPPDRTDDLLQRADRWIDKPGGQVLIPAKDLHLLLTAYSESRAWAESLEAAGWWAPETPAETPEGSE